MKNQLSHLAGSLVVTGVKKNKFKVINTQKNDKKLLNYNLSANEDNSLLVRLNMSNSIFSLKSDFLFPQTNKLIVLLTFILVHFRCSPDVAKEHRNANVR